ncbi:dienelactone hydrolase family protein [Microbacterium testaceum]|uniref:Dienelactone hydrolase domain-containing protein n=1 Tax=Microbacterium testaceum TaxID=2033 RepID=A0A147F5H4_MICTE|nr:dienelactone hydrolase family protein [Microbacterium testaceum]KTS09417.1 hypothetical protein RSA3_13390 [Microbacterium testaceum]
MFAPGYADDDLSDFDDAFKDDDVTVTFVTNADFASVVNAIDDAHTAPVALVSLGAEAIEAWKSLPILRDKVRSTTFVSVPAAANLEVHQFANLPIFDLHSEEDKRTAEAHQPIHDGLSAAGVPHEMVVYGQVQGEFFAIGKPGYDRATSLDAAKRVHDWVMTSLLTDDLREVRSG